MSAAGELASRHVHTYLSESELEISRIASDFPWAKNYTDVYDRFGLVGDRSLFAHGIRLSEQERKCLSEANATVVHCPTSNTFLGSGLFDLRGLRNWTHPVRVGIATDVGGGTSYSMLQTMSETYKVSMLRGYQPTAHELFYIATQSQCSYPGTG